MDTISNQTAPVGAEGATSSQDTAAQVDTQPVETEAVVSDNQSAEAGQASKTLYAGKYQSVEELEKAYQEAQQFVGKASQKAELVNKLERTTGMSYDQIANYLDTQEKQQIQEQIESNPGLAAFQEVQSLKTELAKQHEERQLDTFLSSDEGKPYAQFKEQIKEAAWHMPSMVDKPYDHVARTLFGNAIAQGQQNAYKKIETKQQTQATGAISTPKREITLEDMRNMSAEQLEAILPHA